jgi:hypothetical protein
LELLALMGNFATLASTRTFVHKYLNSAASELRRMAAGNDRQQGALEVLQGLCESVRKKCNGIMKEYDGIMRVRKSDPVREEAWA